MSARLGGTRASVGMGSLPGGTVEIQTVIRLLASSRKREGA
jgi:hypothetical protein